MTDYRELNFKPFFGLASKHLQMIVAAYSLPGKAPLSTQLLVDIGNGDQLSCEVSTPANWKKGDKTILLLHGLGGSHNSRYMIRMARKLYQRGDKVVRINFRNCGSGAGLSKLPYGAGNSKDILKVIRQLKQESPESEITLIGFSLGGNTVLKLAGELGEEVNGLIKKVIAVCPPLDLKQTVLKIQEKRYWVYHRFYLNNILKQCQPWMKQKVHSIYEFDDKITGPSWGFSGAEEYYEKCSSKQFISNIRCEAYLLFAEDDPFISMDSLETLTLPENVYVWVSKQGSHVGFIGPTNQAGTFQWLDQLLLQWIGGDRS